MVFGRIFCLIDADADADAVRENRRSPNRLAGWFSPPVLGVRMLGPEYPRKRAIDMARKAVRRDINAQDGFLV